MKTSRILQITSQFITTQYINISQGSQFGHKKNRNKSGFIYYGS